MAKYRKIDCRIWSDAKFRELTSDEQFFYIYLLTSPHSTPWGAYVLDDLYIMADLKMNQKQVNTCWQKLSSLKLCLRDANTRLVAFPNWFKYNLPTNEKTAIACINGILNLPRSKTLVDYCQSSEWIRNRLANSNLVETEQDQEHKQDYKKPNKAKAACSSEVEFFAQSMGLPPSDGSWFFDKCEGSGWRNNGCLIADWKATFRAWVKIKILPSQKKQESLPLKTFEQQKQENTISAGQRWLERKKNEYPS